MHSRKTRLAARGKLTASAAALNMAQEEERFDLFPRSVLWVKFEEGSRIKDCQLPLFIDRCSDNLQTWGEMSECGCELQQRSALGGECARDARIIAGICTRARPRNKHIST